MIEGFDLIIQIDTHPELRSMQSLRNSILDIAEEKAKLDLEMVERLRKETVFGKVHP